MKGGNYMVIYSKELSRRDIVSIVYTAKVGNKVKCKERKVSGNALKATIRELLQNGSTVVSVTSF